MIKIVQQVELQFIGVAFDRLEPRIHFARAFQSVPLRSSFTIASTVSAAWSSKSTCLSKLVTVQIAREDQDPLADFLDGLRNFVERGGESLNVFAFERSNERLESCSVSSCVICLSSAATVHENLEALR